MRCVRHALLAAAVPCAVLCAQTPTIAPGEPPREHRAQPTTPAITVADAMTRMYIIAADSMEGREAGTRGGTRGETYIANEMRRLGLDPAGEAGSYFQTISLAKRSPDPTSALRTGTAQLNFGTDFLPMPRLGAQLFLGGLPYGGSFSGTDVPVVYGGRLGDSALVARMRRGENSSSSHCPVAPTESHRSPSGSSMT